jgi:hypothetical protein
VLVSDDVVSLLPSSYRFEPTGYDGVSALSSLTAAAERNEVST